MEKLPNEGDMKKGIVDFINLARTTPLDFSKLVGQQKAKITSKILKLTNEIVIELEEGETAYDEAVKELSSKSPILPLEESDLLNQVAQAHADDLAKSGILSHIGSSGKDLNQRVEKVCQWETFLAEAVDAGSADSVSSVVGMIVDDGVPNRWNRLNLLDKRAKHVGVGVASHSKYGICVVVVFCGNLRKVGKPYFNKNQPSEQEKIYKEELEAELEDDKFAPEGCVDVKTRKVKLEFESKERKVTQKLYEREDGSVHILEVETLN